LRIRRRLVNNEAQREPLRPVTTETGERSDMEDVASFRERAGAWLAEVIPSFGAAVAETTSDGGSRSHRSAAHAKALQAALYRGGFAGIVFPPEYGGLGLTVAHRDAFNSEVRSAGPEAVALFNLLGGIWGLSIGMIAPTMLEFATEEQKRTYIPEMLRGEKLWAQMLSEPTGGSDLAGALTRASLDGEQYLINGSKVWTSQADFSDMAVLLARTDWAVPKHRGLTLFIISLDSPGLTINPIRLVSGGTGFCQEFFDDMPVPAANVLGSVNDGWNVASRLLVHERNAVGGGSAYHSMSVGSASTGATARGSEASLIEMADQLGTASDPEVRQRVAEIHVLSKVAGQLAGRVMQATASGVMPPAAGSLLRLFSSSLGVASSEAAMAVAGVNAVVWPIDSAAAGSGLGLGYLGRQGNSMASGTVEIQRNIISERVLGLPREPAADRDVPFDQVRHNALPDRLSGT
jgi:alkylation response protein AidB-like acyl-CoA dehydrogenase